MSLKVKGKLKLVQDKLLGKSLMMSLIVLNGSIRLFPHAKSLQQKHRNWTTFGQ